MNHKLKLFSLILSSFFILSCVHTQDGKILFKKGHHDTKSSHLEKSAKKDKKCCSRESKSSKCCNSKKWGEKGKSSKAEKCYSCKSKTEKCDSCKSRKGKYKSSCEKKDSVVGLALVKGFGNKIKGSVSFERAGYKQVQLVAKVEGLKPNKKFGFHVHEFGNCENKAVMAGAHLNPEDNKHGGLQNKDKHLGDLGNLNSDKTGKAQLSVVLNGRLKMFMGRSVIIHESEDDLKSQPTGSSGKRIACGIIGARLFPVKLETKETAKPKKKTETKKDTAKPKKKIETKKDTAKPSTKKDQKKIVTKPDETKQSAKKVATKSDKKLPATQTKEIKVIEKTVKK